MNKQTGSSGNSVKINDMLDFEKQCEQLRKQLRSLKESLKA
jgi:hypothetical protein